MSKHMKRLASPRRWTIEKKHAKWTMKPTAGAHAAELSLPLGIVLRDYLGVADTAREARRVVGQGDVLVDGRPAQGLKRSVGLMDVVSIPKNEDHYRVLMDHRGRVLLVPVSEDQAGWKLVRIDGKTTIKGGRTQLNLHDGRNLVLDEDDYKTGDVLQLKLPEQELAGHYPLEEGNIALIIGGSHAGELATVDGVDVSRNPQENLVHLTKGDEELTTVKSYVFVVGEDQPVITVPEVSIV